MSGEARLVGELQDWVTSPVHLSLSSSLLPPSLSLSFFLLLFTSLIPVCLFLSSLVKTFSFEFTFKQQGAAHICTPRDTPQSSDFIVFIHTALRCRLSDDLENTKQSDDELLLHKQLPTTANASEVLQTCTSSKKKAGDELQGVLNYLKRGLEEDRNFCCLTRCRRLAAQRLDNSSGGASVQRAWHPPIDQWFHHTTLCKHKERTDRGV